MSNEQPEQTPEGLIGWLRDDADFQDHQRENGMPMLPAAEDAPHLRAAADMLESLSLKLDFERQAYKVAANTVADLQSRLEALSKQAEQLALMNESLYQQERDARSRLRTLAIGIVGARMAHVEEDYAEAYHLLYTAAKELSDNPHEPWKGVDALADGAIERRDGQTFVNIPVVERQNTNSENNHGS